MMNVLIPSLLALSALTQTPPQDLPTYVPAKTTIAIMPIVNLSVNAWPELAARQNKRGIEYSISEFSKRGFRVLPQATVTEALEALKLDMTDEENQNRASLFKVGDKLNADLILFAVIEASGQHSNAAAPPWTEDSAAPQGDVDGRVGMKVWLLDVKTQKIWLTAKRIVAVSRSGAFELFAKGSDHQVDAVADAFNQALTPFFAPYPDPTKSKNTAKPPSDDACETPASAIHDPRITNHDSRQTATGTPSQ